MKKIFSFIRWKFVIPTAIFVVAVVVFFVLFFDPLLTRGLEAVGSKLNGAKVEISGLKTKFLKGRLDIAQVQVASKKEEFENVVEAGPLAFQLDVKNILRKRVVIPESRIDGILLGTTRKTSGFLPKKTKKKKKKKDEKPSVVGKLAKKYENRFKLNLDGVKAQVKDQVTVDPENLELTKKADAIETKLETVPEDWNRKVKNFQFEERLKAVEQEIKSVEDTKIKGLEALTEVPKALAKIENSKKELEQIKLDAKSLKTEFDSEIKALKSDVESLKKAKQEDLALLMSKMNLDFADPNRLVEGLIGAGVLAKVQTALRYMELARKHLPSKKEKEGIPKKLRAEGMDIEFPRPSTPPRFWLKEGGLSGKIQDIDVKGFLSHLTTDPPRVGKPLVMKLQGKKGTQQYLAKVVLDYTGDIKKDSLTFEATGLEVKKLDNHGVLGKSLDEGTGSLDFVFSAIGDHDIAGYVTMNMGRLKFNDERLLAETGLKQGPMLSVDKKVQADFLMRVARGIESMDKVFIKAQILGTWDDPNITFSSNLQDKMAKIIKSTVGDMVSKQKKELEKQLNDILAGKQGELNQKISKLTSNFDGRYSEITSKIQSEINRATGINLPTNPAGGGESPKIPGLDSIFK